MPVPVFVLILYPRHDHIARLQQTPRPLFVDQYKHEVSQMKRHLLDYVKMLRATANPTVPLGLHATANPIIPPLLGTADRFQPIHLQLTDDGFPILPYPFDRSNTGRKPWRKVSHDTSASIIVCTKQ
jgi:hypothetical protein